MGRVWKLNRKVLFEFQLQYTNKSKRKLKNVSNKILFTQQKKDIIKYLPVVKLFENLPQMPLQLKKDSFHYLDTIAGGKCLKNVQIKTACKEIVKGMQTILSIQQLCLKIIFEYLIKLKRIYIKSLQKSSSS